LELRKPTAAEIVHCLDKALATRSRQDAPDDTGAEPLWAPLLGRNFDALLLDGCKERWTRMARLGTSWRGTQRHRAI
jgi:hypothetical protein